jgi:DNA polymerase IV
VYGIGATTARGLYAIGLRTLEHLERYYDVWEDPEFKLSQTQSQTEVKQEEKTLKREAVLVEEADVKGDGGKTLIRAALGYREDLAIKYVPGSKDTRKRLLIYAFVRIPRDEVEEIGRLMMAVLEEVEKGCVSTIVGG